MVNAEQYTNFHSQKQNGPRPVIESSPQGGCSALSSAGSILTIMKNGYFLVSRKIIESDVFYWKPDKWFKIWIYILSCVVYEKTNFFDKGEAFFTYKDIAEKTKANKHEIDHCIRWMKKNEMCATRKATGGMIIKVIKYSYYQEPDNYKSDRKSETKAKQKRNESDTYIYTDKEKHLSIKASKQEREGFQPPTLPLVKDFFKNDQEAEKFFDHFTSNGWKVGGRAPMKNWPAAARNWIRRNNPDNKPEKEKNWLI